LTSTAALASVAAFSSPDVNSSSGFGDSSSSCSIVLQLLFRFSSAALRGRMASQVQKFKSNSNSDLYIMHTKYPSPQVQWHKSRCCLWVEVGAHAVRKRPVRDVVVWAGAGVAWHLCVCDVFEAPRLLVSGRLLSLCGAPRCVQSITDFFEWVV
jgi:hypothetical protein